MNPLLKRILARAAATTTLLAMSLPALAVTPTDYAMPYTVASTGNDTATGITLVRSARFNQSAALVPAATPVIDPKVHHSGAVSNNVFTDYRPQLLSWGQGNRWMLANLRGGLSPTPVQISSENSVNSVCTSQAVARSQRNAANSALIYQLPGLDGVCGTTLANGLADNVVRAISLDNTPSTAPLNLPLVGIQLQPVYNSNGALRALYAFDRGKLLSLGTALTDNGELASGIGELQFAGHTTDGTVILIADGNLHRIRSNGVFVARPLKKAGDGFKVVQALINGGDVYFVETALDPGNRFQGRIFRVPADGSARATLLTSVRVPGTIIQGLSDARVIYSAGGGFDLNTFKFRPTDLLSIPRTGGADPVRLLRVASGFVSVIHVSSDKVFHTATSTDLNTAAITQSAYISQDTGPLVSNFRAGSAWSGSQIADAGDTRLLLAQKGLEGSTRGARLSSFNPADLSSARLVTLAATDQPLFAFGFGRGSIGALQVEPENNSGLDVFAFDLFGLRFTRLTTDAGSNDEFPVF